MKRGCPSPGEQPAAKVIAEMDVDSPASPPEQESGQRLHGGLPDWIAVTRRRAAKPRPDNGRPKPLATANVFKPLPVQETPGAKVTAKPSQARPTPIIISKENFDFERCRAALLAAGIKNFNFNIQPHMAQLSCKTKADKESALAALKGVERLQFHTYTDKDDRAHISVVQGLYYSSAEELGSALELGFKPTKVVAFKGDALVPRYQVTLPKSTDIGAFRKIKYICHQSVRIYKYNPIINTVPCVPGARHSDMQNGTATGPPGASSAREPTSQRSATGRRRLQSGGATAAESTRLRTASAPNAASTLRPSRSARSASRPAKAHHPSPACSNRTWRTAAGGTQ
ncbi:uncharacterized protein LOC126968415 [Leptidea sinapis]|uniref:uncharacterized protein LOC126968415 n=1 Tax=Leptidea sinapis TaxID=189913 RepID=UPI0021C300AE|nr:uncharacterized protein LOC126968415 [Leptidea sinapis]